MNVQKRYVALLLLMGACALFSGCASSRKPTVSAPTPPPKAPDPLKLAELPEYGTPKQGFDTSAGCLVLGELDGTNNQIIGYARDVLVQALRDRGYTVIDMANINTAEDRKAVQKVVQVQYYSARSHYLPTKSTTATDFYLVVSVRDIPEAVLDAPNAMRSFTVWSRDFADSLDPALSHITTKPAIEKATANLFCVEAFCRALEPVNAKSTAPVSGSVVVKETTQPVEP